ncbi:hypothetical protein J1785_11030 [Rahnella sp. SL6]|nr:hypothetical protein [Rahnella perminowiae]
MVNYVGGGMSGQGIWSVLGIEPTQDLGVIKRAYARKLKNTRPDSDPQGYQRLREAFEAAKRQGYDDILSDVVTTAKPPVNLSAAPVSPLSVRYETVKAPVQESDDVSLLRGQIFAEIPSVIDAMMDDETVGIKRLADYLQSDSLQNLELREMFSQEMAAQLSEREGLYSALLLKVSAIMGWEIDHYQPVGISPQRLQALQAQIEHTGANYYASVMAREYQGSALNRLRLRLLTEEGAVVPWWAKLVPDFMLSLHDKLREIRAYYPALLPGINSVLLKTLAENRLALRWGTVFLTGFWLLLIMLATREHAEPWRSRILLIAFIALYMHGYSYLERKLRYRPRMLCATECVLSILATGIMVKIMLGLFTMFKPETGNMVMAFTNYGVLSASSFCVLWMMAPKQWKWYSVPLNAMIIMVIFPWELMKKASGVAGIVAFVVLLVMYSLLIAFGFR